MKRSNWQRLHSSRGCRVVDEEGRWETWTWQLRFGQYNLVIIIIIIKRGGGRGSVEKKKSWPYANEATVLLAIELISGWHGRAAVWLVTIRRTITAVARGTWFGFKIVDWQKSYFQDWSVASCTCIDLSKSFDWSFCWIQHLPTSSLHAHGAGGRTQSGWEEEEAVPTPIYECRNYDTQ